MEASFPQPPFAELHLHLRGSMPVDYLARQLAKYPVAEAIREAPERQRAFFARCPNLTLLLNGETRALEAEELFRYESFENFLGTYLFTSYFVRSGEDFRALVAAVVEGLAAQGTVYAEITVSVFEYLQQGILLEEICETLSEASRRRGPTVRWIVDLVRNIGPTATLDLLQKLIKKRPEGWVGITLGGAEHLYPPAQFQKTYERAGAEGLRLTVHAGEALGAWSVRDAVLTLGAERIGHGVRAVEDEAVVELLAERQIALEVCPTGNIATGVYGSFEEHSLPRLVEAGIPVTLNTDDPTFFRTSLAQEFERAREMGISEERLKAIRRNAFKFAFDRSAADEAMNRER